VEYCEQRIAPSEIVLLWVIKHLTKDQKSASMAVSLIHLTNYKAEGTV
jgi:hypothetical protein